MKFKRRAEGLSEARKVGSDAALEPYAVPPPYCVGILQIFRRARSDKDRVNYQIFVASALMEYHCDKVLSK